MQRFDARVKRAVRGQFRLDEDSTMVEFNGIGRSDSFLEINPVAAWLQRIEVSAQALMQVHQCCVDVIKASGEPQSQLIEPRHAIPSANRDDPRLIRLRLEQQVTPSHRRRIHIVDSAKYHRLR